jgi:hypothetical protein
MASINVVKVDTQELFTVEKQYGRDGTDGVVLALNELEREA